jgi:hypothetical protein
MKTVGLSTAGEIKSVFSFLRKIVPLLIIALLLNGLFISIDTYSSGLFYLVLKSTPLYYTIFSLSVPVGMALGAPLANFGPLKKDNPLTVSLLLFLFAPLILVLSIGRSPLLDIADGLIIGLILPVINIPIFTKLMKVIPYGIYGKTQAFLKVFTSGTSPVMGAVFSFLAIIFQDNDRSAGDRHSCGSAGCVQHFCISKIFQPFSRTVNHGNRSSSILNLTDLSINNVLSIRGVGHYSAMFIYQIE